MRTVYLQRYLKLDILAQLDAVYSNYNSFYFSVIRVLFVIIISSIFIAVFPGVPAAPGMPCPGEDRTYFLLHIFFSLKVKYS